MVIFEGTVQASNWISASFPPVLSQAHLVMRRLRGLGVLRGRGVLAILRGRWSLTTLVRRGRSVGGRRSRMLDISRS